jgi:tRNA(Ile)-lysidine synthase
MTKLEKKLRAALRQIGVGSQDQVVAAVSGGGDSTAMLDALARLREQKGLPGAIIVAHLNHQLRGEESDEDERFVREFAGELCLPVHTERIAVADFAKSEKRNLEATARRLRYEFLQRVAQERGACFVFTAHTQDDQAETILMRLLRGSGAEGLRGVHHIRALSDAVKLVRPMLRVTRAEVLEHCEHYAIAFRTDASNLSIDLMRNRVRHELLPMLRTFNPRVEASLSRISDLLTEDEEFLQRAANEVLEKAREDSRLNVKTLRTAHPAIVRRVLRLWLRAERGDLRRITATHIAALEGLINGPGGRRIELPEGWNVSREFGYLRLSRRGQTSIADSDV